MFGETEIEPVVPERPRTVNVLILLAVAALVFSYLGAYAVTNALVSAKIIALWPANQDPRPRWMLVGFVGLMIFFGISGLLLRFLSGRQLKSLDALADAEEEFPSDSR